MLFKYNLKYKNTEACLLQSIGGHEMSVVQKARGQRNLIYD